MSIDPSPLPEPTPMRTRARSLVLGAADVAELRLRRLVRRQLDAARRSDSRFRRGAYVAVRQLGRRTVNAVTDRQLGWRGTLWAARWLDGTSYEITGWAYERGYGYGQTPRVRAYLRRPGSDRTIEAEVRMRPELEINGLAKHAEHDYANTGFVAIFDVAPLLADPSPEPWQVHLEVTGADGTTRRGTLKQRHRLSSAGLLGGRTFDDDVQVIATWRRRHGLHLRRHVPSAVATDVHLEGEDVRIRLQLTDVDPERVELVSPFARRPLDLTREADGSWTASATVPPTWVVRDEHELEATDEASDDTASSELKELAGADVEQDDPDDLDPDGTAPPAVEPGREGQRIRTQVYVIVITDRDGQEHKAACRLDRTGPVVAQDSGRSAYASAKGRLAISDAQASLLVEDVRLEPGDSPRLHLSGRAGGDLEGVSLAFVGRRQELAVDLHVDGGRWTATADLHQGQWGGPDLLPRMGGYTLRAFRDEGPRVRVACSMAVISRTPEKLDVPESRLRLEVNRGRTLRLRVGVTRAADELGSFHQRRMDAIYVRPDAATRPQQSVYLESFYGRLATCNPHALDEAIARELPGWTRYWGVTDLSVPVPEGAVPVVEGTRAWFEARTRSRYVVANDWLRRRFIPQPFQTVVQTWHGSMFKRIGLDRPAVRESTRQSLLTERAKWDVLVSQNHHSTQILRSAYAWDGEIYEEGYPRNDRLSTDSGDDIRARLGIRPDQKAILYAPTWRDDVKGMVTFLDLQRLADDLGEDYVILLRGHSRTVGHGSSVRKRGVIDVSTYPSITELFLAADALVTDYSSVMFDYSVTRRPMIFFVPDLDVYRDQTRGVYFDLAELAPGPVVATQDEVTQALRSLGEGGDGDDQDRWRERYEAWVERFNAHDDGHSAERIVRRLLAEHPPS